MAFRKILGFSILVFILSLSFVGSSPPAEPVKCSSGNKNCTVTNSFGTFSDRTICRAAEVVYPTTERELISIVSNATKQQRKMKAVTSTSHSMPKLVCPDGENGILIGTKYLNHTVDLNVLVMTITVEPGMTLRELINVSANVGLAIPYVPYWWGLTVGGLLGTGAHGSTLWNLGSALHDYIVGIRIVTPAGENEGYAKVRILENGDSELDAARVSLGVLGVISQVTFKLQPMFKRSITYQSMNDSDLGREASIFGIKHEFGDMMWYPSQQKVVYRIDDRVPSNTSGNGLNDFLSFRSTPSLSLGIGRGAEEAQESFGDADGKCINGELTYSMPPRNGYGLTNDGKTFTGYPVVGNNNRLQASGTCLDSPSDSLFSACPWDPRVKGIFYFQTGFTISLSKVNNFIQDVQQLVTLSPKSLCVVELYDGILMRYVTASKAYLGRSEDSVDFGITYYRSKDPNSPRMFQDILEEIEQMGLLKYGGIPHWGKNRNLAFDRVIQKYKNGSEFLKVRERYDPMGLFSSEWTDRILGLRNNGSTIVVREGCALEGLCICSQDIHCAPMKGYFCRRGKVYTDARVCTKL